MSGIRDYISKSTKEFKGGFNKPGAFPLFLRALTARILWVTLAYTLVLAFTPYQDFLTQNGTAVLVFAGVSFFWGKVLKDHVPEWLDEFMTGKIFFREENVVVLNVWIVGLFIAVLGSIFMLPKCLDAIYKRT